MDSPIRSSCSRRSWPTSNQARLDEWSKRCESGSPPIDDVAVATAWWSAFEKNAPSDDDLEEDWDDDRLRIEPQQPYRAPAKVGRNEPCPCGSGKKFKKCCGR